ncbi:hypothetical protein JVX91_28425 [Pseudomonas sp. PDNC002]|uniref:hypothetical protein n=1 Tax=Pseudomonas sp. PDNC002 TaxID=2811422 RepID=UPI00196312E0|nr:hypothetical protein [Pseudomonas sp. PDNC002]QRY79444.1 hypothetical protein JVX91_28425 [Pseudomonas sp. PDNC002]
MYTPSLRSLLARSVVAGLLACAVSGVALADPSLAERRAITAYEQGIYASQLKEIQAAAGFAVPVEVNWNSIALPDQADAYASDDFWTNVYFVPLKQALASVAADDMGKQALKEKLKKITVRYDEASAPASDYAAGIEFKGGTLALNFKPYSNSTDIEARAKAIQSALEAAL